jgi:hypothetical protein
VIEQWSTDRRGWARFSDDMTMRYRLARSFTPFSPEVERLNGSPRVVFLLLNPSIADAFQLDPTVKRCVAFATSWGADVVEVVNIFALRSTDPNELYKRTWGLRGDHQDNDREIVAACTGAFRVVAGWGKHGALDHRGRTVRTLLCHHHGIKLHHLGLNQDGSPKHPLYIRGGTEPQEWTL